MLQRILFASALAVAAPFCPAIVGDGVLVMAQSNDIVLQKKLREARECYDNGNYAAALERAEAALKRSPRNSEALYIKTQCVELLAEQRRIEQEQRAERERKAFNSACEASTSEQLRTFINTYPTSTYIDEAKRRLADFDLWESAQKSNTREAYEKYLSTSSNGAFAKEARENITRLEEQERERVRLAEIEKRRAQAEAEWQTLTGTSDITRLEAFLRNFPDSEYEQEARFRLAISKAEKFYMADNTAEAISAYAEAQKYGRLTSQNADHYADAQARHTYKQIIASSNMDEVYRYLGSLDSTSPYYVEISNHYAILLANSFTTSTPESDLNRAVNFACDATTRSILNQRFSALRQQKRQAEYQARAAQRQANWKGRIRLGWELFGIGGISEPDYPDYGVMPISTALLCRFGHKTDAINFIFGAGYRWFGEMDFDDGDAETVCHQLYAPAKLRINMGRRSRTSRFFIGGGAEAGIKLGDDYPGDPLTVNWTVEMGFVGEHYDFSFFYKRFLEDKGIASWCDPNMLGMSLSVFF